MTDEMQTLLVIRGSIAGMPDEQRQQILDLAGDLKKKIAENPILGMAIALVGAELATEV